MTREQIVTEVIARGYDFISSSRIGGFVDRSYQFVCARHEWPFLETSMESEAPIVFTDLRKILSVKGLTTEESLRGVDRRVLEITFPDITETGTPEFWYLEGNTLKVYPVETESLSVHYRKIPATMGESSEPLVPAEFQYLIVDRAIVDCLRDSDEYAEARALLANVKEAIDTEMAGALLSRNTQNAELILRTGPADYYV